MKKLVIIGAGDTGREVVDLAERINSAKTEWELLGFVDDYCDQLIVEGYPVLGGIEWLNEMEEEIHAVCSIGNGVIKKQIIRKIINNNVKYATLIDPKALFLKHSSCGQGCIIYAGAICALNSTIGNHVYVGFNATVGHDTIIGDYSSIYPGSNISGKVVCGECCEFGTGSKVIQGINISESVNVGAGAVIVRNILTSCTVVGCPARPIT